MTLQVTQLSYYAQKRALLDEVSLTFHPGQIYGIMGLNGAGKSTLLKTLARIWEPTKGNLSWHGQDLLTFSRQQMSRTLTLVPQQPNLHFDLRVFQLVLMGGYCQTWTREESMHRMRCALEKVQALHLLERWLSELSGGEKQRIYLARALMTEAPILLLDEPMAHLDRRCQRDIWSLLTALVQEGRLLLVALHDWGAAQQFCQQLILLQNGRCQFTGPLANF